METNAIFTATYIDWQYPVGSDSDDETVNTDTDLSTDGSNGGISLSTFLSMLVAETKLNFLIKSFILDSGSTIHVCNDWQRFIL